MFYIVYVRLCLLAKKTKKHVQKSRSNNFTYLIHREDAMVVEDGFTRTAASLNQSLDVTISKQIFPC